MLPSNMVKNTIDNPVINLNDMLDPSLGLQIQNVEAKALLLFETEEFTGSMGVEILYVKPHQSFHAHTHPGYHVLLVLHGAGTFTLDDKTFDTKPGDICEVKPEVAHAVGAKEDGQYLLSINIPYKAVDDPTRLRFL